MPGVSVNVKFKGIYRKISPKSIERGRYAMANQMHADMDRYVPADQWELRTASYVAHDGSKIVYQKPYAAAQYQGFIIRNGKPVIFQNYTTPGTGPEWDKVAKNKHLKSWKAAFVKGVNWL